MKKIYVFLTLIFINISISNAETIEEYSVSSGGTGTNTASSGLTRFLGTADQRFIDISEQYIRQKLGEDYYNKFINLDSGSSYEDCIKDNCKVRNEITFTYKIPFETTGDPLSGGPPRIQVTVDSQGGLVNYVGPIKPYQFLISKEEAIAKTKSYGLIEITGVGIATSLRLPEGYELVWAVSSKDLVGECRDIGGMIECIYKGVYVDVDSGDIRGEYTINPLIMTPTGTGGVILDKYPQGQNIKDLKKEIQTKKIKDTQIQTQKTKVGFFRKIIKWLKSLL